MQLNFKTFGQGKPIIILHGMFGTLDNWQAIARRLAEDSMVFIIDQRNHGRSPHIDGAFDYQVLAEDLHRFMEENWIYEAAIVGHSMGGKAAMQFAMLYPDMVERLAIIDVAPKAYPGGHEKVFEALYAVDPPHVKERQDAENTLRQFLPDDEGTVQFLMKNLSRNPEGGFEWKMNLDAIHASYQAILGNIDTGGNTYTGKSVFIRGSLSRYIEDPDWANIKSIFPAANLITITNASHWVHADRPEETYQALKTFLS